MESKFFAEIEKSMNLKTIKDFEKEVRTKIISELESLRKKNEDLNKRLLNDECQSWLTLRHGGYFEIKLNNDKKKKLFRLIDIYSNFAQIVDGVKNLNTKVESVKKLKELPDE